MDEFGHGTHCAGIAAANGTLKGIAPGAYLINARVLDSQGGGYTSWILNGINWAVANGADIISMSLGQFPGNVIQLLNDAVNAAWDSGSMVVVAAGNYGPTEGTISSPGMASKAITVGASDSLNDTTWWSSKGPSTNGIIDPDIIAPGDNILSTFLYNCYKVFSGTSMATPAVAGVAALLRSAYPSTDIDLIRSALISTATDIGRSNFDQGAGLVNAYKAFEYLQNPANYAYPSFSASSPLKLSPNERFDYQLDIYVNQSYTALNVEPSANLASYVSASFIDPSDQSGWIRTSVQLIMPDIPIMGELFIKNGTSIIYSTDIVLEPEQKANDANTGTDAGETFKGAISISTGSSYKGEFHDGDYQDIYAFPVSANHHYRATLSHVTADIDLFVTDENGTIIFVTENQAVMGDSFIFTALTTTHYFVRLITYDCAIYTLKIEDLGTNDPSQIELTGIFDSYAVDKDSNGLYDSLVFAIQVNVTIPGKYDFLYVVSQYRSDYFYNKYYIVRDWVSLYLSKGVTTVELPVDGGIIEQSNYDGSYILSTLLIGNQVTALTVKYMQDVFHTETFNHNQFEPAQDKLVSISYLQENLDGLGGAEIFSIKCDFDFTTSGAYTLELKILDSTQTLTIASLSEQCYIDNPTRTTIFFNCSAYLFRQYANDIIIAGINIWSSKNYFVPIYDTIPASTFVNCESLFDYQINEELLDADSSGLFDTLRIDVMLNLKTAMQIRIDYDNWLFCLSNEQSFAKDSITQSPIVEYLFAGENHLYLEFSITPAALRKLSGPYLLPFISISAPSYKSLIKMHYVTEAYNYSTFDVPSVFISQYLGLEKILTEAGGIKFNFEITSSVAMTAKFEMWVDFHHTMYQNYFYLQENIDLVQGTNNVSLLIGYQELFERKVIADLLISMVKLSSTEGDVLDSINDVAIIYNVDYRDFNAFYDAYIIGFDTTYIDSDNNTLYEGVNITIEVQINKSGIYHCALTLDPISTSDKLYFETTIDYTPGQHNVTFFISARDVVRHFSYLDGRTRIKIKFENSGNGWTDKLYTQYTIQHLSKFDYKLPVLYQDIIQIEPFDENNDNLYDGIKLKLLFNITEEGDYSFNFAFMINIAPTAIALDILNIENSTMIHYTQGCHELTINILSEDLLAIRDLLDYFESELFFLGLFYVSVTDTFGSYYLITETMFSNAFNVSQFDLRGIAEITDVVLTLGDENSGTADCLMVAITINVYKETPVIIFYLTLKYYYYIGEILHSEKYFCFYQDDTPTLGIQSVVFQVSFQDLFLEETPKTFDISAEVSLRDINYNIIDVFYTESQTFELNLITPSTTPTTPTTASTKKHKFPILTSFVVLVIIALVPLLRKKTKY
ncbi:MAG: S8 family peptidase [Candidatus Heimdallarchaeaceae archaeon]